MARRKSTYSKRDYNEDNDKSYSYLKYRKQYSAGGGPTSDTKEYEENDRVQTGGWDPVRAERERKQREANERAIHDYGYTKTFRQNNTRLTNDLERRLNPFTRQAEEKGQTYREWKRGQTPYQQAQERGNSPLATWEQAIKNQNNNWKKQQNYMLNRGYRDELNAEKNYRRWEEENKKAQQAIDIATSGFDYGGWTQGRKDEVKEALDAGNVRESRSVIDKLIRRGVYDKGNNPNLWSQKKRDSQKAQNEETIQQTQENITGLQAQMEENKLPGNRWEKLLDLYDDPDAENERRIINGAGYTEQEKATARDTLQAILMRRRINGNQSVLDSAQSFYKYNIQNVGDEAANKKIENMRQMAYDAVNGAGAYEKLASTLAPEDREALDARIDDALGNFVTGRELRNEQGGLGYTEDQNAQIDYANKVEQEHADLLSKYELGDTEWHPENSVAQLETNPMANGVFKPGTSTADAVYTILGGGIDSENLPVTALGGYANAALMNDDERDVFLSLYNAGKKDEAAAFYDGCSKYLNQYYNMYETVNLEDMASRFPVTMSAETVGAHLAQPVENVMNLPGQIYSLVTGKDSYASDPYNERYAATRTKQVIRNKISQNLGDWGWVYNGMMSGVDSALNIAIAKGIGLADQPLKIGDHVVKAMGHELSAGMVGSLGLFATQAFETSLQNNMATGSGNFGYDWVEAFVDAAIETATEIWTVENWLADPTNLLTYVAKIGISEPSEEIVGAIVEPYIKQMIGHKDEYTKRAEEIWNDGYYIDGSGTKIEVANYDEAKRQAMREWNHDIRMAAQEALISVGPAMGRGVISNVVNNRRISGLGQNVGQYREEMDSITAREEQEQQAKNTQGRSIGLQKLMERARQTEMESPAQKMADRIEQKEQQGKKISSTDVGKLAVELMQDKSVQENPGEIEKIVVRNNRMYNQMQDELKAARQVEDLGEMMATDQERQNAEGKLQKGPGQVILQNEKEGKSQYAKIARVEGGKFVVTINGQEQKQRYEVSSLRMLDPSTAFIIRDHVQYPGIYTEAYTNKLLQVQEKGQVKDVPAFLRDAERIRLAAMRNAQLPQTTIPEEMAQEIYAQSQQEIGQQNKASEQQVQTLGPGNGRATFQGAEYGTKAWARKMNNMKIPKTVQKAAEYVAKVAKISGLDLRLMTEEELEKAYVDLDASKIYGANQSNEIRLNLDGWNYSLGEKTTRHSLVVAMGHEMTHWLKNTSPAAYYQLQDFVMSMTTNDQLMKKIEGYKRLNVDLDMAGVMDEITAEACDQMLGSQQFRQYLEENNQTLFKQVQNFVRSVIERIKNGIGNIQDSASMEARNMMRHYNELAKLWLGAYDQALTREIKQAEAQAAQEAVSSMSMAQMEEQYEQAIKDGDVRLQEQLVKEAAQRAGYTEDVYHGTDTFGYTEFNMKRNSGRVFVAYSEKLARSYTRNGQVQAISERYMGDVETMTDEQLLEQARKMWTQTAWGDKIDSIELLDNGKYRLHYFDTETNKQTNWDVSRIEMEGRIRSMAQEAGQTEGVYHFYGKPGKQLVIDAEGAAANQIYVPETGRKMNTHQIADWAKAQGYDSVRINNVMNPGVKNESLRNDQELKRKDVGIYFNPADLKSADAIVYDDNGKMIPLSERFNAERTDVRWSMAEISREYDKAVKTNDEKLAQQLLERVGKAMGFDTDEYAYHGTSGFGFTEFDMDMSQDEIFVSFSEKLASTYTPQGEIRKIGKNYSKLGLETMSVDRLVKELLDYYKISMDIMSEGIEKVEGYTREDYAQLVYDYIQQIEELAKGKSFENQLTSLLEKYYGMLERQDRYGAREIERRIKDRTGQYDFANQDEIEDRIRNLQAFMARALASGEDVVKLTRSGFDYYLSRGDIIRNLYNSNNDKEGIYKFYTRPGKQLIVDAEGNYWSKIPFDTGRNAAAHVNMFDDMVEENEVKTATTREIAEWAREHGYTSVRINDVYDNGGRRFGINKEEARGDIAIFFNEEDIKSADPFTYDDNGELIPIEERFSDDMKDFRWSMAQLDEDYEKARKAKDETAMQKLVDEAAKKAGYVKAGYHGTLSGGFTIFDKSKAKIGSNSGAGFYFSSNKSDSDANYSEVEGADNWFKANDLAEKLQERLDESGEEELEYDGYTITADMSYDDIVEIAKKIMTKNPQTYSVYLDPGKAYIRDNNKSTNLIDVEGIEDLVDSEVDRDDFDNEDDYTDEYYTRKSDAIYEEISRAVYEGFADVESNYEILENVDMEGIISKLAEIAYDYEALTWDDLIKVLTEQYIDIMTPDMTESTDGSHEIARAIVEAFGFDSIEDREVSKKFNQLKNMGNAGDTIHYIMFHPSQIKSADTVTYDKQGKVIPLSERFNKGNNDIRWSMAATDPKQQELSQAWQEARDEAQELREKLRAMKPEMDAWVDRLTKAMDNGKFDEESEKYKEWEKGYLKVSQALYDAEVKYKKANKALEDYIEERDVNEEKEEIKKSGLTEAEYRRKQAADQFGYTTDFREAGYLLPNGKMLNFTGEKGKHYGTRGEDHRAIGIIYASSKYQGGEAMMQFMRDGNIRVMGGTPGIDIISTTEPTAEQYAEIRRMARRFASEHYFNIDFTNNDGYTVDNIEYDGRVDPERVVNDIKSYFKTGEVRQQSVVSQFHYSMATTDNMDVGEWMMNQTPGSLHTEGERQLLQAYRSLRTSMDLVHKRQSEYKAKIKELESKGRLDAEERDQLIMLKNKLQIQDEKEERLEEELFRVTSNEGYANLMYKQRALMNDFIEGKTQAQVMASVDSMRNEAERAAAEIAKNERKLQKMAEDTAIRTIRAELARRGLRMTAETLRSQYNTAMSQGEIEGRLAEIVLKELNGEDATADIEALANDVVTNQVGWANEEADEALAAVRGMTIEIGPGQQQELKATHSSLKEIRQRTKGSGVKFVFGEHSTLDQNKSELEEQIPELRGMLDNEKESLEKFVSYVEGLLKMKTAGNAADFGIDVDEVGLFIRSMANIMLNDEAGGLSKSKLLEKIRKEEGAVGKALEAVQEARKSAEGLQLAGRKAAGTASFMRRDVEAALDYYNQIAKQAAQVEKQKVREGLIETLKSENTRKLLEQRDKYEEKIKTDKKARQIAQDNASLKKVITTDVSRLRKRLTEETDQKNIQEESKPLARFVTRLLVEHDLNGWRKVLNASEKELTEYLKKLNKMEEGGTGFDADADLDWLVIHAPNEEDSDYSAKDRVIQDLIDIESGLLAYRTAEGKGTISLQDRKDALQKVQRALSEIYSVIRARSEAFIEGQKWQVYELAEMMQADMAKSTFKGERTGKLGRTVDTFWKSVGYGNLTPEYFIKNLKNRTMTQLHRGFYEAEQRAGLEARKAKQRIAQIAEESGYATWDGHEKHKIQDARGQEIEITTEQLMALYATWLRESNALRPEETSHLLHGGFVLAPDMSKGAYGRMKMEQRPIRMSKESLAKIGDQLTDAQKQYVQAIVDYMSGDLATLGNEASLRMFGIKKFTEKYYFPIKSWGGVLNKSSASGVSSNNDNRAQRQSFTKRITANARNTIEIGDFTPTVMKHIVGMINYNTVAPAVENLNKVLNQQLEYGTKTKEADDTYKRNIRAAFQEAYGKNAYDYLTQFMLDVNGGVTARQESSLREKLLSVFKKNAVAGSLSVAAQQPLSYIRAAMMINPKYLAQALSPTYWKGSYEEMMQHSGVAVIKDMGKFDMNYGRSMIDYITPEAMQTKLKKTTGKISDAATSLPQKTDVMAWTRMWSAVKLEQAALHPEMDTKSEAFLDMVADRFNDLMRRTQVYDSVMVKSQNMRSNSYLKKVTTSFMAEPTLSLNVLADAWQNIHEKGGKANAAKALATFFLSAAAQAGAKALFGAGRSPNKKKNQEENFWYKFWYNLLSEANPLGLIPGYRQIVDVLTDGELDDDAMGMLGKAVDVFDLIFKLATTGKGSGNTYRDLEDTIGQMVQLGTSVPLKNFMRDFRAMVNWFSGGTMGELTGGSYAQRETSGAVMKYQLIDTIMSEDLIGMINTRLGEAGYKTNVDAYVQRIYEAQKAGNQQAADEMKEYLTLTQIKAQDPEKTLQQKLNKLTKEDENISAKEKAEKLSEGGYGAMTQFVTEQYAAGKIDRKQAEELYKKENPNATEKDIMKALDKVDWIKAGHEGDGYTNYTPLMEGIANNSAEDISKAVKYMTAHGYEAKNIKSEVNKRIKEKYLKADAKEKIRLQDAMNKAYKALGFTTEDAEKTRSKWKENKK